MRLWILQEPWKQLPLILLLITSQKFFKSNNSLNKPIKLKSQHVLLQNVLQGEEQIIILQISAGSNILSYSQNVLSKIWKPKKQHRTLSHDLILSQILKMLRSKFTSTVDSMRLWHSLTASKINGYFFNYADKPSAMTGTIFSGIFPGKRTIKLQLAHENGSTRAILTLHNV